MVAAVVAGAAAGAATSRPSAFSASRSIPRDILLGHTDWVQSLAFSPDGAQLASASGHPGDERAIRRWDVTTGKQVGEPLLGHRAMLTWVAYSPGGKYLASASHDGTVRLWDPTTGSPLRVL